MNSQPFRFEEISAIAIRRWRLLLVVVTGMVSLGLLAWFDLPRQEDATVEPFEAQVNIIYPGASPEDVEAQVTRVLEDDFYGLDGVEYVESVAFPNGASFHLKLEEDSPMDVVVEKVRGLIRSKRSELPPELEEPEVYKYSSATFTAQMIVAVTGNRALPILTESAKRLRDEVASLPGVASVHLRGAAEEAAIVRIDPELAAQYGLSVDDIVTQLAAANIRVPAGRLSGSNYRSALQISTELGSIADVSKVALTVPRHSSSAVTTPLSLADVADVYSDSETIKEQFVHDGTPGVALEVRFRANENAVALGSVIRDRIARYRAALPQDLSIQVTYDQSRWVAQTLSGFTHSLLEGVGLVMLVIAFGLGWRAALVVSVALPLSMAGAILGMRLVDLPLQQISVAGLIVALGLLVDDAIVVTESIQTMRDRGHPSKSAAVLGTARVFWANNGTTAVICAAFLPLFFMGGGMGEYIRGLPMAVIMSIVTSVVVAQLFTPWLASLLLKPHLESPESSRSLSERDLYHDNAPLRWMVRIYLWVLPRIVRNPLKTVAFCTVLLVLSVLAIPRIGIQFFPKADKPVLFASLELPAGTPLESTRERLGEALRVIGAEPDVVSTSAMVGAGYPSIFLGRSLQRSREEFADVMMVISDPKKSSEIAERLRVRLASLPGVKVSIQELYSGPPVAHPVLVRIHGTDYRELEKYAAELKGELRKIPGAINIGDSLSDRVPLTRVSLDADSAARDRVAARSVGRVLRLLHGDDAVTQYSVGGERRDVIVKVKGDSEQRRNALLQAPIPTLDGRSIPLRSVGELKQEHGYAELNRRNNRRIVEVYADVAAGTLPSQVVGQVDHWLETQKWQLGYGYGYAGEQEETAKSFRNLGLAALGGILVVFFVLVWMFDSVRLAAGVVAAIPFGIIGAVTGLAASGNPFGFMAFLGLVALTGIFANHKIYFVDRYLELRAENLDAYAALSLAGAERLRPVLLTAMTTVLGLLPLTLQGGAMWSAFGWLNIFGLMTSVPLSLLLVPCIIRLAAPREFAAVRMAEPQNAVQREAVGAQQPASVASAAAKRVALEPHELGALAGYRARVGEAWRSLFSGAEGASRLPAFDGVRALACMWVIALHVISLLGSFWLRPDRDVKIVSSQQFLALQRSPILRWMLKGELGVDMFFVISGFLICLQLLREYAKRNELDIRQFYARRLVRLYPAYLVAVLLYAIWDNDNLRSLMPGLLYVNNFVPTLDQFMLHAWSLAVEWQFYLLFPWFLWLLLHKNWLNGVTLVGLLGLSFATRALVLAHNGLHLNLVGHPAIDGPAAELFNDAFYDKPYTRFGSLLVGVALAYWHHVGSIARFFEQRKVWRWVGLVLLSVLAAAIGLPSPVPEEGVKPNPTVILVYVTLYQTVFGIFTAYLLGMTLSRWGLGRPLARVLGWRGFSPLAKLSYGAYLLHPLALKLVYRAWVPPVGEPWALTAFAIGFIALAFLLALPLYLLVEHPFLGLGRAAPVRALSASLGRSAEA